MSINIFIFTGYKGLEGESTKVPTLSDYFINAISQISNRANFNLELNFQKSNCLIRYHNIYVLFDSVKVNNTYE